MPSDEPTAEGELAHEFLTAIGERIRARRTDRGLTVQQLADGAGVSRRLITQIEHGQANPSLVTVTRVARQLGAEFTQLLSDPAPPRVVEATGPDEHRLVWSSASGSSAHLLAATDARSADLWRWLLRPGDAYHGRPDPARSQELFHVLEGSLTLVTDEATVVLGAGDAGRLRSDRVYAYRNDGTVDTSFVRVVALAS